MINNNNPKDFAKEITMNFDVMQRTLDKGGVVDLEFIEKLAVDLEKLNAENKSASAKLDNKVISQMENRLADLASRCTEVVSQN